MVFFIFIVAILGVLPAIFLRDHMLLSQIKRVLVDRGSCLKCRYSLIGLPVITRLFVVCPDCHKQLLQIDGAVSSCAACKNDLADAQWQEENVIICAECGSPGTVDKSLSELTRNSSESTPKNPEI